jgi:RNA-directed DNA polymerase
MAKTQDFTSISTRLQRIAEIAKKHPKEALKTLAHHIDVAMLEDVFGRLRPDAATGVDKETYEQLAARRVQRFPELREEMHSGSYRAPPVRRVYIPKGDGDARRPIGIPTLEDKVLQKAVADVLGAVYEQSFLDCSYGYRPGRSAHQALAAIWKALMVKPGGWVIEADIASFFDTLDHGHLRAILAKRIQDGVLNRMIGKWLNAGVMEAGAVQPVDEGTPQGGVISPLLANVYLHEVLDAWFEQEVKPRLRGTATLVRFADDFAIVFEFREDAARVFEVLPKRFERYGLRLHPEKTRLIHCRPTPPKTGVGPKTEPTCFDFLGFTHYWGKSRKGRWILVRKTMRKRFTRTLKRVSEWCSKNRHADVNEQHKRLSQKLNGHYAYFGITGNFEALARLHYGVRRIWHYWLCRRSNRGYITWPEFNALLNRMPLARPRIVHKYA